jgi:hypothetical protein
VNESRGETLLHFVDCIRKNGRSKSSEEISRSSEGCWILRRCKVVTAQVWRGSKLRRGRVVDPSQPGPLDYSRDRLSGSREKSAQDLVTGIAILRYAISRRLRRQCGPQGVGEVEYRWHEVIGTSPREVPNIGC